MSGGSIDVADLSYMFDYLFFDGPEPPCFEEADLTADGFVDILDLKYLQDYLFFSGPDPYPCGYYQPPSPILGGNISLDHVVGLYNSASQVRRQQIATVVVDHRHRVPPAPSGPGRLGPAIGVHDWSPFMFEALHCDLGLT